MVWWAILIVVPLIKTTVFGFFLILLFISVFFHLRVMHTIKSPTHYYRSSPIWQLFRFMDIVAVLASNLLLAFTFKCRSSPIWQLFRFMDIVAVLASNLLFRVVAMPWLSLSRPRIWHWGERVNFWSACWYTVFILARGCCYHCYFAVDTEVAVVAQ